MFKTILVNLLLLSIVACPINCMGGFDSFIAAPIATVSTCACCAKVVEHAQNSLPPRDLKGSTDENSDDCRCPSCVCNGAVIDAESGIEDLKATDAVWYSFALERSLRLVADDLQEFCHRIAVSHRPSINSGSFVRILNQSLLN